MILATVSGLFIPPIIVLMSTMSSLTTGLLSEVVQQITGAVASVLHYHVHQTTIGDQIYENHPTMHSQAFTV